MTTIVPKALFEGTALTTSNVDLYTSPTNVKTSIQSANLVNTTAGAVIAYVYLIESGGTASAANAAICALSLGGNATYQCPELVNQVMESGDKITAHASANASISFRASGAQVS